MPELEGMDLFKQHGCLPGTVMTAAQQDAWLAVMKKLKNLTLKSAGRRLRGDLSC